jgi:general stress protein YciG
MSGTKVGGLKAKATNLKLHGQDFYQRIGKKGGQNSHVGGFGTNPVLARIAGSKGGRISTRKGIKNGEGKRWKNEESN